MWIDLTDDCLPALQSKGWKVTNGGGKSYLVAPNGQRYPLSKGRTSPSNLYVIQARGSARFKVGISSDPCQRIRGLQIGSPLELELVCSVKIDSQKMERRAHDWEDAESFRAAIENCQTAADVLKAFERRMRTFWQLDGRRTKLCPTSQIRLDKTAR